MSRMSIGQRIKRAYSRDYRAKLATEWAEEWRTEQERLIARIEWSIRSEDRDLFANTMGLLKESTGKRFDALPRVIALLAEEDISQNGKVE